MPIYEYRRPDGSTFEVMQSFSEEALTHDPETGVEVQRVLHAPAVHFKGKGFYNTDYGTRNRQRETAASAEGSSGGDSGGDSSGDPASKGDSKSSGADGGSSEKDSSEKSSSADGKAKGAKDGSTSKAPAATKS
jgi:putative FmdB family regulatory protein